MNDAATVEVGQSSAKLLRYELDVAERVLFG